MTNLLIRVTLTNRRVREDRENVGQIPNTGEEEEEKGDTFGRLSLVVQKELGEARAQVEHCTEVSKYLAQGIKSEGCVFAIGRLWRLVLRADVPAQYASGANECNGGDIEGYVLNSGDVLSRPDYIGRWFD